MSHDDPDREPFMKSRLGFLRKPIILPIAPLLLVLAADAAGHLSTASTAESAAVCPQGTDETRRLPLWYAQGPNADRRGWYQRLYIAHLPPSYDGTAPFPVVIDLHGAGGNKEAARVVTCPGGNLDDPDCLDRVADCEGFITVYPDGTPESWLKNARSFNAGGGADEYACVSGEACARDVNDILYVTDLVDALERTYVIDPARIYVTGMSNGGAMAHRLACELSDRIAAIASVASGNQFSAVDFCSPIRSVPVLEIHGTNDRCWPYAGGAMSCGFIRPSGLFVSEDTTLGGWASRNGCQPTPVVENLPDIDTTDRTTVTRASYQGCTNGGDVVLLRINGGGHTWPGGSSVLPRWMVGRGNGDVNANRAMWEFFKTHPMR